MYDWLIIGGGIHGVTIATFLLQAAGVKSSRLLIIDPNRELLCKWKERAKAVGMKSLRSSAVHHLDLEPFSLRNFASSREGRSYGRLRGRFGHPDLELFSAHCERVISENGLEDLHLQDSVLEVTPSSDNSCKEVSLTSGKKLCSKQIVLALGNPASLWPDWASKSPAKVFHAFDSGWDEASFAGKSVAVVGGGLSAAQIALKLLSRDAGQVKVFSRHPLKTSRFDSDPGWIGPKYRDGFEKAKCPVFKRRQIVNARRRGSITPEVYSDFTRALREQRIELNISEDCRAQSTGNEEQVKDTWKESLHACDRVILATGFQSSVPGDRLVSNISRSFELQRAPCGVPLLGDSVEWGKSVFVSGALAEMRIGPISRNISGARSAAAEITNKALSS